MTPTKVVLERTATHVQLRVFKPNTLKGSTVIESVPLQYKGTRSSGASLPGLRKYGAAYAKRFSIPFEDQTQGEQS